MSETENKKNNKGKVEAEKETTKKTNASTEKKATTSKTKTTAGTAKPVAKKTSTVNTAKPAAKKTSTVKTSTKSTDTNASKVQPKVAKEVKEVKEAKETKETKKEEIGNKSEMESKSKTATKAKVENKPKTENKTENKKEEKKVEEKQEKENKNDKEDTVSLKQIREALENKVSENQKHSIIKENIINVMIAVAIILYLIIVFVGSKSIQANTLEIVLKAFSIAYAVIGLIILEIAYKKDNLKILFCGGEILIFGAVNLCMMYVAKLHPSNLLNVTTYISIAVAAYYLIKITILTVKSVKKYKKDNSDIKEIIKK